MRVCLSAVVEEKAGLAVVAGQARPGSSQRLIRPPTRPPTLHFALQLVSGAGADGLHALLRINAGAEPQLAGGPDIVRWAAATTGTAEGEALLALELVPGPAGDPGQGSVRMRAWAPGEEQQLPAPPGAATLADAMRTAVDRWLALWHAAQHGARLAGAPWPPPALGAAVQTLQALHALAARWPAAPLPLPCASPGPTHGSGTSGADVMQLGPSMVGMKVRHRRRAAAARRHICISDLGANSYWSRSWHSQRTSSLLLRILSLPVFIARRVSLGASCAPAGPRGGRRARPRRAPTHGSIPAASH